MSGAIHEGRLPAHGRGPHTVPRRAPSPRRARRALALAQGGYYLATGVWSLVSMRSFERVTGPKTDRWLVRTVGVLVSGIGIGLIESGARGRLSRELERASVICAAGLIAIEVPLALRGRIAPVYLLDAVAEAGFVLGRLLPADADVGPT